MSLKKNSPEVSYERRKTAEWLAAVVKFSSPLNFSFFKCLHWSVGDLKPILKAIVKDAEAQDDQEALEALMAALRWPLVKLVRDFDDLLSDYPCIWDSARKRFERACRTVAKSFSSDSRHYAWVRRSLREIFGLSREAAVLCEFVYFNQTRTVIEEYFEDDVEIWKSTKRDALAKVLGVSSPALRECVKELTSFNLLEASRVFRLVNGVSSLWEGMNAQDMARFFCAPLTGDVLPLDSFRVSEDVLTHVKSLLSRSDASKNSIHIMLYGPPGTGKTTFARSLAKHLGLKAWAVASRDDDDDNDRRASLIACLNMAKRHRDSFVLVDEAERLLDTSWHSKDKAWLNSFLEQPGKKVIWVTNQIQHIDSAVLRRFSFSIHFGALGEEERRNLWNQVIARYRVKSYLPDSRVKSLVENYSIPAAVIEQAVSQAKDLGYNKKEFGGAVERVLQAHVALCGGRSSRPKAKPEEEYALSGVRLDGSVEGLLDKCRRAHAMYVSNGSLRRGGGTMLFYGPPGTGKTALARHIAHELGRECLVKRASDLLSSWVGESEQNVAEAFRRAEMEGAVLVIDEADTFLYSREIAQRSWENSIVNEFLTALEECKGFCICTTNRMEKMDAAAMRRFSFKVGFTYSGPEQIEALYASLLAPLADGSLPPSLEAELRGMTRLTPGDFHAVRSQHWLAERGELSHEELIRALKREQEMKLDREERRVGFSV
ncbi:MAG: AAA family ATPase [Synergistaceae bacterium]|jgi:SpoVK/Ycf46/Vps4 family AAA+-type ATPase|nr:AAA family ATPase [Synergistaceae bacterium]